MQLFFILFRLICSIVFRTTTWCYIQSISHFKLEYLCSCHLGFNKDKVTFSFFGMKLIVCYAEVNSTRIASLTGDDRNYFGDVCFYKRQANKAGLSASMNLCRHHLTFTNFSTTWRNTNMELKTLNKMFDIVQKLENRKKLTYSYPIQRSNTLLCHYEVSPKFFALFSQLLKLHVHVSKSGLESSTKLHSNLDNLRCSKSALNKPLQIVRARTFSQSFL